MSYVHDIGGTLKRHSDGIAGVAAILGVREEGIPTGNRVRHPSDSTSRLGMRPALSKYRALVDNKVSRRARPKE